MNGFTKSGYDIVLGDFSSAINLEMMFGWSIVHKVGPFEDFFPFDFVLFMINYGNIFRW